MGNRSYAGLGNTGQKRGEAIAVTASRAAADAICALHDGYEVFEVTTCTFVVAQPDQSHYVAPETSKCLDETPVESPRIGGRRAGHIRHRQARGVTRGEMIG